MKKTTECKLMKKRFEKMKSDAVKCLLASGAEVPQGVEPNSWEGMMALAEDIERHGKAQHRVGAMFAVAKWTHGCMELQTLEAKTEMEELLESEMAEEQPAEGEKPAEETPAEGDKPAKEPAKIPIAPQVGK